MEQFGGELAQLVADMEQKKRQIDTEMQALRQEVTVMCLGTVADLAQQALRKVESVAPAERDQLQRIQQQVQEPLESSRMAAYDSLRTMHKDCQLCKNKEACAKGRALLIMRDLVVLTVAIGKGPMSPSKLKTALEEALRQGCGRFDLDKVEQSQLTLAFNKVISLGCTREGFGATVRSANMYGPELTNEEVQQLFLVYNACARASPQYISKNKETRNWKHRKRSASPHRELAGSASTASPSIAAAPVPHPVVPEIATTSVADASMPVPRRRANCNDGADTATTSVADASMPVPRRRASCNDDADIATTSVADASMPVPRRMASCNDGADTATAHSQETMCTWQLGANIPFLHSWGEQASHGIISFDAMPETPPCKHCGIFDLQGCHTPGGYYCSTCMADSMAEQDLLWEADAFGVFQDFS